MLFELQTSVPYRTSWDSYTKSYDVLSGPEDHHCAAQVPTAQHLRTCTEQLHPRRPSSLQPLSSPVA